MAVFCLPLYHVYWATDRSVKKALISHFVMNYWISFIDVVHAITNLFLATVNWHNSTTCIYISCTVKFCFFTYYLTEWNLENMNITRIKLEVQNIWANQYRVILLINTYI